MSECLFCKIVHKEIPATIVHETDQVVAFKDINPLAKEHYLFIHKKHTDNVNAMMMDDANQVVQIYKEIAQFTSKTSLEKDGFRVVTNINKHRCQSVFHTHFHVLGGEQLAGFGK